MCSSAYPVISKCGDRWWERPSETYVDTESEFLFFSLSEASFCDLSLWKDGENLLCIPKTRIFLKHLLPCCLSHWCTPLPGKTLPCLWVWFRHLPGVPCSICFLFALKEDTKSKLVKTFVSILIVLIAASSIGVPFSACSVCASSSVSIKNENYSILKKVWKAYVKTKSDFVNFFFLP